MERENRRPATPMTLTVRLSDELGRVLKERASLGGQAPEEYVLHLIERDAGVPGAPTPVDASGTRLGQGGMLTDAEFDQLLGQLSSGPQLPHLPADFSRADLYSDHD